jgi:hypothetical protein
MPTKVVADGPGRLRERVFTSAPVRRPALAAPDARGASSVASPGLPGVSEGGNSLDYSFGSNTAGSDG